MALHILERKRYTNDMQESSSYAVGLDIGTNKIRTVVAHIDSATGVPTIVGVGEATNSGMRKGVVVNLQGPGKAIDEALDAAERMSGYQVNGATISLNGSHILTTHADGMVAATGVDHEVNREDIERIKEVATLGKVPANREILDVISHAYKLDGQDNIKDPIGMTGTRLEVDAHVISALTPYVSNVEKAAESAQVEPHVIVPTAVAASRAVLSESQRENGVAVIDFGASTTGIAVYEEGDLQYVGVVPIGGNNITNDLAIGLKIDPELAEEVKVNHAHAVSRSEHAGVSVKHDNQISSFKTEDIDEIVEARLEEIFEGIQLHLKKANRAGRLPAGVVLVGGASKLKYMTEYAKESLGVAARLGNPTGFGGVADDSDSASYATAIGLMLIDAETVGRDTSRKHKNKQSNVTMKGIKASASKLFGIFKP